MSDTKEIKLSDYAKNAKVMGDSLCEQSPAFDFLQNYNDIILSSIPITIYYDEERFETIDFFDIAQKINKVSNTFCRSFLITGKSGCGKRTLEKYFKWKFYDFFYSLFGYISDDEEKKQEAVDELILYYEINMYDFLMYTNEKCCDMIISVFNQIKKVCTENMENIIYISFGDLTDIFKRKKTSKIFTRCMKTIMNIPQNRCIITGVYDGDASEIKEKIKSPFIIENLDVPDEKVRYNFFYHFITTHKNFVFDDIASDDKPAIENLIKKLCEITEEFNFKMLNRLTEYITMELKGQAIWTILHDSKKVEDIAEKYKKLLGIIEDEYCKKYYIDFSRIKEIAESIRKNTYTPAEKNTVPFMINSPVEKIVSDNKNNENNELIEPVHQVNTIAEILKINYPKQDRAICFCRGTIEMKEDNKDNDAIIALEMLENKRKENSSDIADNNEENRISEEN